jgi:hypothetical protein
VHAEIYGKIHVRALKIFNEFLENLFVCIFNGNKEFLLKKGKNKLKIQLWKNKK